MNEQPPPKREHPSTYFVQNRASEEELNRLRGQDQMLTTSMGGVLPEQTDPASLRRVLDVGCGTGGWVIEVAKAYPNIETVIGVDISSAMVTYARTQASRQHLDQRVEFHGMDALRMLEFPVGFFDLVNQRLGMSYLRTWDWPKLLQEYRRVTRPGGIIRITEATIMTENNSPALTHIGNIALEANSNAGHLFTFQSNSVILTLADLMRQHGLMDVQTWEHHLVYQSGTPEGQQFAEDMAMLSRVGLPFLQKWTRVPDNYEEIRQQAIKEMQQPDFVATWTFLTAWGIAHLDCNTHDDLISKEKTPHSKNSHPS